jgi:hypothetical protein
MANKPHEFPTWTELDSVTIQNIMVKLPKYLWNICDILNISTANELEISQDKTNAV